VPGEGFGGASARRALARILWAAISPALEMTMNDEALNLSIRKFLKMVGVKSQHEIEQAVARGTAAGTVAGSEAFPATMTLEVAGLKLKVQFDGEIKLE
jgi:hypothetical protein